MAYATVAQFKRFIPARALGTLITDDDISSALDDASAELDGFLVAQYELPLQAWGNDVSKHVCWAAGWAIMQQRGLNPEGADSQWERNYDRFLEWARQVSRGMINPPGIVDGTPDLNDGGACVVTGGASYVVGGNVASQPVVTSGPLPEASAEVVVNAQSPGRGLR